LKGEMSGLSDMRGENGTVVNKRRKKLKKNKLNPFASSAIRSYQSFSWKRKTIHDPLGRVVAAPPQQPMDRGSNLISRNATLDKRLYKGVRTGFGSFIYSVSFFL
jgi:hypothetical protein